MNRNCINTKWSLKRTNKLNLLIIFHVHLPPVNHVICLQCEACLDLLVRAFNEVFSPVIETAESRRESFHDVDEITNYYKRDKDGSLVLDDKVWLPSNLHWRRPKSEFKEKDTVGSLFKQLDFRSARSQPDELEPSQRSSINGEKSVDIEADIYPLVVDVTGSDTNAPNLSNSSDENSDEYEEPAYHPKGGYAPGRRPLLDLIIKFLEMFQVTADKSSTVRSYIEKSNRYTLGAKDKYDD